jgi:ABC-type phosphate transport system auxiliary subunit
MDSGVLAGVVSGAGVTVTGLLSAYTAITTGRDRKERDTDRAVREAEKGDIIDETRSRLLKDINMQLKRATDEAERNRIAAEKYREEAEKYRIESERCTAEARRLRDELITEKARSTRVIHDLTERGERLTRRAEVLEAWISNNRSRFKQLGIDPLPFDLLEDRRTQEEEA